MIDTYIESYLFMGFLDFCTLSAWLRCCMYRRVFKNSNYPRKRSFEDTAFFHKSRTLQKERSKTSICIEWHILVKIDKNFQWTLHTSAIIALKDTYLSMLFAKSCTNKYSKSTYTNVFYCKVGILGRVEINLNKMYILNWNPSFLDCSGLFCGQQNCSNFFPETFLLGKKK